MKIKEWFRPKGEALAVQTLRAQGTPFGLLDRVQPLGKQQHQLYDALREAVPIVDAALGKLIRLMGSFQVGAADPWAQEEINKFLREVPVGGYGTGIQQFLWCYLDNLLCYGNAVGEMVLSNDGSRVAALYNAPLQSLTIKQGENSLNTTVMVLGEGFQPRPVPYPELVMFSALNPKAGEVIGRPLLEGLPFVSSVLLKIFHTIGQNFDRVGNLRFAVTYKPNGPMDQSAAQEIAQTIAQQWSSAMSSPQEGMVKDFVAVGDVDIRVIGADNQILDTQVPVRQMLEQIVAKLGLPPFMLGLSWSSTERMSKQQADILTSELESYRAILDPVILKICKTHLLLRGMACPLWVDWDNINLQDEVELARADLLHAQAKTLEEKKGNE